jgi:transposase-like protein
MEIITGVERRRSWPLERKLAVLEEASRTSESAASVARRHDI